MVRLFQPCFWLASPDLVAMSGVHPTQFLQTMPYRRSLSLLGRTEIYIKPSGDSTDAPLKKRSINCRGTVFSHGGRRRRSRAQGSIGGVPKHPRIPFKGPRVPCLFRFCFVPLFLLEWSLHHQLQRCSNDTPRIYLKRFSTGVLAMQCLVCLVLLEFCRSQAF